MRCIGGMSVCLMMMMMMMMMMMNPWTALWPADVSRQSNGCNVPRKRVNHP